MPPPVYLDECVYRSLAPRLRQRGFAVTTFDEAGMSSRPDEGHLAYTASRGLVLLSHNGRHFRRLHRRYIEEGREHGGILIISQTGPPERLEIRAAMLLDWLPAPTDYASRYIGWGDLQFQLTQGLRLPGYTDADHRLALGQGDERTPRR